MNQNELIDAVNRRAIADPRYRARLEIAVGSKNRSLMRDLIIEAVPAVLGGTVEEEVRRKIEEWFLRW